MAKLGTYQKKRDFSKTSEPSAEDKSTSKSLKGKKKKLIFTIQRHHATRLHYDFRLEVDGVLKSWAVPKGPSLNPKDRRLAVQVEDHPLDYADFEGTIPKGNYGAGTVIVFDHGTYDFLEAKDEKEFLKNLEAGSIKFSLNGKIFKGEFALVRMKNDEENQWLLIKHKDNYATDQSFDAENLVAKGVKQAGQDFKKKAPTKKSENTKIIDEQEQEVQSPMLSKLATDLPLEEGWLYEKKFDGFRAICSIKNGKVELISRNGNKLTKKYPSLIKALKAISQDVVLDGEIVIEDKQNNPNFQLLASGEPIDKKLNLVYYVFDALFLNGVELQSYSLLERKEILHLLFKKIESEQIQLVEPLSLEANKLIAHAEKLHWEGIMAKRADSTYQAGKRSSAWLKVKLRQTQEAIICGYTEPQGGRSKFGALVLGINKPDGLHYIGNCGTGFNEGMLKDLHAEFSKIVSKTKPFPKEEKVAKEAQVTWLKPELVCDVYYSEWTADQHLRHPVFKGLRTDKKADQVEIETKNELAMENDEQKEKQKELTFGKKKVSLTNLQKIYWPEEKISKGDMLNYYETIAPYILPYLKDKPISMHRFPNGIDQQSFFQKDVEPDQLPEWIKTTEVYSKSTDKHIDYMLCNDEASLLYIANLGSIEINPWLSTYKVPDKPQFAVLDLDPNGADFTEVKAVALTVKAIIDKINLPGYIKTSGSTGLHIYFNVNQKYDYDIVRDFVQLIAELAQQKHENTTSLIRDPKKRKGLIYLDYLQNNQGQTIAAPYSVRPKPGATVSAPLAWKEINDKLDIKDFDIFNMVERAKVNDPWSTIWKDTVDLKKALAML
ncbi:DNA ligase D [Sphingobacterium lactis]|uniref:DNA ligase D n=1 Tax=Sphingobacterium lactis TaxID=797291 RepID=UPI003F81CF91